MHMFIFNNLTAANDITKHANGRDTTHILVTHNGLALSFFIQCSVGYISLSMQSKRGGET